LATFKRYQGAYFWSLLVASCGLILDCLGVHPFLFRYNFTLCLCYRHLDRLVLYGDWPLNRAMVSVASRPPSTETS
jgi:hypothetical protein